MVGTVRSFSDCISQQEKSQRISVIGISILLLLGWLVSVIFSHGIMLAVVAFFWVVQWLMSEYNVKKLQAHGVTVSANQFAMISEATNSVCQRFNVPNRYRVIILPSATANAFAVKFARKHVIVILSELLEGVIGNPEQVRALVAHEMCHLVLGHGWRGVLQLYKPAKFKSARELTCDNAALVGSNDLAGTKTLLKKLCVGKRLFPFVNEQELVAEADVIYSGVSGWLLKMYLTHPPAGTRLKNVTEFAQTLGMPLSAETQITPPIA